MVFIFTLMGIFLKENGKKIEKMDMDYIIIIQQVKNMKEIFKMVIKMDKELIIILMAMFIKEIGLKEVKMVLVD